MIVAHKLKHKLSINKIKLAEKNKNTLLRCFKVNGNV
jgi:hypothetical protein